LKKIKKESGKKNFIAKSVHKLKPRYIDYDPDQRLGQETFWGDGNTVELRSHSFNTESRLQRTVSFAPTKSSYVFSKINPPDMDNDLYGQRTLFCVPSHKHIVNPALWTLVIRTLSIK